MCCPVMACLSCFFVVVLFCFLCYSMCSNHCGDLEVAPLLSFVVCVCVCVSETRAPTLGSTRSSPRRNFCLYYSPVPPPSRYIPRSWTGTWTFLWLNGSLDA